MGLATTAFALPTRAYPRPEWHPWTVAVTEPAALIAYAYPGFVVARRRPRNRIGWLLLVSGFGGVLDALAHAYTDYALTRDLPGITLSGWVSNWAFGLNFFPLYFLLLCFPDGRLPSGRWRPATWYVGVCGTFVTLTAGFIPGPVDRSYYPGLDNPFGISWFAFFDRYEGPLSLFVVACPFLVSAGALLCRFRRSVGADRQPFKWVALAALVGVVLVLVTIPRHEDAWLTVAINLILVTLSASIAVAIVRHNLFDIDRLLSRTLVHLCLTGCVVGLYVGLVSLLGLVLRDRASGTAPLLATGVVAAVLQPLRALLHRAVGRLMYGLRDDPYTALAGLGRRLAAVGDPLNVLPEAATTVAEALRSPYVAIDLDVPGTQGGQATTRRRVAAHGTGAPVVLRLALVHRGTEIGELAVATRSADETFSAADLRLLDDVTRHLAQAAAGVRLSLSLQRAREHTVLVRAEERRRLSRDLHDGVGPALAGATHALREAAPLVRTRPGTARSLMDAALDQVRRGGADLRRISLALRSPVDQLGLREALLAYLDRVPLTVHASVPDEIPRLPAAVEEAAYRILTEVMDDVLRTGGGQALWVRLELTPTYVVLSLAHDADGSPAVASPRERAAELGGDCAVGPRDDGRCELRVRLPRSLPGAGFPASREATPWPPGAGSGEGGSAGGER
ncbi:hypothetical protein GCM10010252_62460 [Streptomyces aureoverticillatus]|nr:hypothetical protein GCM10010252_62460 [Streptomyces aureoverticillatus]